MKALPVILFVVAVIAAFIEWEHGRVHEAVSENAANRIQNLQIPDRPTAQVELRRIQPGPLGVGKASPRVPGRVLPPHGTAVSPAEQIARAQADQAQDTATLHHTEGNVASMRLILTVLFIPACFFIILAKNRFDDKGRGFAYTTLGVILTFWLHN